MNIDIVQIELVKKNQINLKEFPEVIDSLELAINIFIEQIGRSNIEIVALICMESNGKILNYSNIAMGNNEKVKISLSQLFKTALLSNAKKIMVAHNHPSGALSITESDVKLTKNIAIISNLLGIELIDSIIVNKDGKYISIRENIKELI